jgi:ketosteroid isomerase-like protein
MPTNADLIRASYDAFRRGDLDAALALFHPEIAWTHPDGMSDYGLGGTKHGHAELRAFMKHARTLFQEIRPMPREFLESGNRVVVLGTHSMRSARTGRACTVDFVHSWVLEDGKATHFTDFHDTAPVRRLFEPAPGPDRVEPGPDQGLWHAIRTALGFWESRVLLSAVELDLFTVLAERPLELSELTRRLELHPRGTRDFLDALVALGFLERDGALYKNAPGANTFLNRKNPALDVTGLLEVADALWYDSWRNLTTALRTGQPQNKATAASSAMRACPASMSRCPAADHRSRSEDICGISARISALSARLSPTRWAATASRIRQTASIVNRRALPAVRSAVMTR